MYNGRADARDSSRASLVRGASCSHRPSYFFRSKGGLPSSGGEFAMMAENVNVIAAEEIPALADGTAAAYRFNLDIA